MSPIFVGTLYQLFDPDISGGVMTLLEAPEVRELKLEYNYQKGVANNFRFDGILALEWMDTTFWPKKKALKGDAPEILLKKFDNLYFLVLMISVG